LYRTATSLRRRRRIQADFQTRSDSRFDKKNCVTLDARASRRVMQKIDEAVELPQDSLRVSIASQRIPDTDNVRDATGPCIRCQAQSRNCRWKCGPFGLCHEHFSEASSIERTEFLPLLFMFTSISTIIAAAGVQSTPGISSNKSGKRRREPRLFMGLDELYATHGYLAYGVGSKYRGGLPIPFI